MPWRPTCDRDAITAKLQGFLQVGSGDVSYWCPSRLKPAIISRRNAAWSVPPWGQAIGGGFGSSWTIIWRQRCCVGTTDDSRCIVTAYFDRSGSHVSVSHWVLHSTKNFPSCGISVDLQWPPSYRGVATAPRITPLGIRGPDP